jgi:hypothetical protein
MDDGSFCVVFRKSMPAEYHEVLEGYLHPVTTEGNQGLLCAFCSAVTAAEPFIQLRLTHPSDDGHIFCLRIPSHLVVAIIDQRASENPIGFQARVDQLGA